MSEMRVSDPSKLHLKKKELTQIRKAARVLRDPGTTSSWRSPLNSSRSMAAASAWKSKLENQSRSFNGNGREKSVFLYNWKNHKSSSEKSAAAAKNVEEEDEEEEEEDDDDDESSSSLLGSYEDSLSDARNGCDSKSDSYLGVGNRSSVFRCRDANPSLVSSARRTVSNVKKKSEKKKINTRLDNLSKYQQRETSLGRKLVSSKTYLERHSSMAYHNNSRDDSIEQSDDTEDYCNSEDLRRISGASPLLLKLKNKNWSRSSSKFLRSSRKEDSSYSYSTPALSTSSYNRYGGYHNPSTVGSWDATTTSMNDGDDEVDDRLESQGGRGCGIPCYWSKRTPKHRGMCGSSYSPSFSDTLRRKGSSLLCGNQSIYPRHRRYSSLSSNRWRVSSRGAQGVLPLLTSSGDVRGGSSVGTGRSDDELSTNFGELYLEGLSRLDGRRWSSSCRSQEGLEIVAVDAEGDEDDTPENSRSFSQKYRPTSFGGLIGQNIVVQSLMNAVLRDRIAPVYLFQGPRGTGKTSTARIFAAALNCIAPDASKPCGYCRECTDFISGKSRDLFEVDGTNKKGIDRVGYLLKRLSVESSLASSRYTVFVIDECHLLPSKTWLAFLKFLEEPPQRVVFMFITTDLDNVPRTIQSRCQKYLFNKIKEGDIVARLRKISAEENLDVEPDALDLIAINADGSLRDAETMLEQLSLLGKRITALLVNELVGVVSDEKLLELLELAMSSETSETVKRAREVMDSGVDPMILMSQMASLIMDIIAGSYTVIDAKPGDLYFGGRSLNESELERLKHALKLLSDAEKQLRTSSERSTWFTATLLQLGSTPSSDFSLSSSSRRQSYKSSEDDPSSASQEVTANKQKSDVRYMPRRSTSLVSQQKTTNGNSRHQRDISPKIDDFSLSSKPSNSPVGDDVGTPISSDDLIVGNMMLRCVNSGKLYDIWACCIERCHSKTLRQLLHSHGKLVSICEVEAPNSDILSSWFFHLVLSSPPYYKLKLNFCPVLFTLRICRNSLNMILLAGVLVAYVAFGDRDVKLRAERFLSSITNSMEMVLRQNVEVRIIHLPEGEGENLPGKQAGSKMASAKEKRVGHANGADAYSSFPPLLDGSFQAPTDSSDFMAEGDGVRVNGQEIPTQRIESIIHEQRLETAWLQAVEKGSPGSLTCVRPEKNQVLPQENIYCKDPMDSIDSTKFSSKHLEDDLNQEVKVLNVKNGRVLQKGQISRRLDRCPMSPSLLHDSSLATSSSKDNLGYESGSGLGGCNGFLCWNNSKRRRVKVRGTPVGAHKVGHFSLFGAHDNKNGDMNRDSIVLVSRVWTLDIVGLLALTLKNQ
ncbi:protein STICHEL [Senna tora]|uniref:Protein STICHEL n=1 Tax=Senna tora TaxID=362788 RepID=A0A835CIU4_9FABA|nr:protein STICHEL [Senna tora]